MLERLGAAATVTVVLVIFALTDGAKAYLANPLFSTPHLLSTFVSSFPSSSSISRSSSRGAAAKWRCVTAAASHAENLRERGWTVLAEPVIDAALVSRAHSASQSRLANLLAEVEVAGCEPTEQQYRFREIVHRQRNRWDLQIPAEDPIYAQICSAALAAVTPIVTSAQGAAYIGIEPIQDGDGTEFWAAPRLEESTRALARHFLAEPGEAPLDVAQIAAPMCRAGGLIVFDYRTIHRGLENPSEGGRERHIAYITCATGGARDSYNFPETSIAETDASVIKQFPFFNELSGRGRAQDALEYYTEIEGNSAFDL